MCACARNGPHSTFAYSQAVVSCSRSSYNCCSMHYPQFTGLRSSFPCPDRLHGSGLQWGWLVLFQHVRGPIWEGWKAGAPTIRMLAPSQMPRLRCDDRRTGMLTALRGLSGSVTTSEYFHFLRGSLGPQRKCSGNVETVSLHCALLGKAVTDPRRFEAAR